MKGKLLKSKKFKAVAILLAGYAVFVMIVLIGFFMIRNNPIDKIAMPYIWDNKEIEEEYGEINGVYRNIKKSEKSDTKMIISYSVKTQKYDLLVYVTLEKYLNNWEATSLEVKEVKEVYKNV